MANGWVGTYKGMPMYKYTKEEFTALKRRERNIVYLVGSHMVLNDSVVGIFENYSVKPCEAGINIYDLFGMERPTMPPKPSRSKRKIEALKEEVEEKSTDTLVE